MKSNKLKSLAAMATVTSLVSMTSTGYQSSNVSNNTNNNGKNTTLLASTSMPEKISPDDLQVDITNVSLTKTLANNPSNTDKYIPENNVPETGDIATAGTIVTYNISVTLRSKSGKLYNVPDFYLTANPIAKYMTGDKAETAQEQEAAKEILNAINVKLGQVKDLNSTSTFTITASFNIGESDWDMDLIPNIKMHINANGKQETIPVNAPDIKLTRAYTNYIQPDLSLDSDANNPHVHYLNVGFGNSTYVGNKGVYNVNNSKVKSVTFKIVNPDPNELKITPLDVPGLVENADGTYTIPGSLANSMNKLFKITSTTNNRFIKDITVEAVGETFTSPSGVDASAATTNYYEPESITVSQNQLTNSADAINMQQSSVTGTTQQMSGGINNNKVTYSSTIDAGLHGKYKVYTGSLVTNGEVVLYNMQNSNVNNDQTYYSLNQSAVNILKSGTAQEKEKILYDMAHGQMNGIGEMYTASQMTAMINANKALPNINFVMSEADYNGSKLDISSSYITAPTAGINNRVISRTYTIGVLQGNYTPDELKTMDSQIESGKASQDGIITTDGKFDGFMMSPPNSYTDEKVQADGINQITDTRYEGYSHGLSSGVVTAYDYTNVMVDNLGNLFGNSVNQVNASWLNKPHNFTAAVNGYGSGAEADFTNHSQMVINMGAPFKIIGPVQLGGIDLSSSDYKIEGDKLVVNMVKGYGVYLSNTPTVTYSAQYTEPNNIIKPLDISAQMVGPDGHQGLQYNYNNIPNHSVVAGGLPTQTEYHAKIVIARVAKNDCQHSSTPVNSNNESTLTDMVQNENGSTKQYMIVGQLPTDGANNLPGEEGAVSQGGLNTKLESLDTDGAPTWVLPKSALNAANQALLDSPDANDLKGKMEYVENPENGWIKYVPGKTDLSDVVGYVTTPTVQGGQDFKMQYKVKLGGVDSGTYQIINSAFKYYDMTNNIGSTSNIVSLTPPGEDLNYTWVSGVTTPTGELTKAELDNTVDGHSLQELFGHGPDNDGSWDLTPKALQSKVDLATNAEEMKKLGYKLDEIEVNGKAVTPDWFKTVGILQNSGITHIKFVISKLPEQPVQKYTDTVKVVDENNQLVIPEVSVTGLPGTDTGLKTPKIPEGYHIVKVTDNNKIVEPGVPSKFTNDDQNIVYHIAKNPNTTVSEVYPNGKPVVVSKTTTNLAGDKVDTAIPDLPNGYQITKITVNGKVVSENEVPTVQSTDNQTIVYTIGKVPTDTVKVMYNNTELVPPVSKTGKTGTETGLKTPEIPKGYHVVNITNGNGDKVTGVPSTFGNNDNTTIYHVEKDITDKVYVDVKTESGTVLTPSHEVASGAPGAKIDVQMPQIPNGYHIVKVTVDNKVITPNAEGKYELPKTLSDNQNQEVDNHIEVIVAKNPTTTVEEKYQDGTNVVPDKITTNLQGVKVETGLPKLPEGYKVIKITVNGKEVSQNEVPTVQSKDNQTIVYTIGKVSTDTVKVVDENNQPVVPKVSVTGVSGTETGLKTPKIPNGYHIVKVTINNKTVEPGVPSKFTNDDQNIVYHIAKNPNTTVSEVYPNGKPVVASKTTTNLAGDKVDTAIPDLPNGYQITKITVNGKVVSENEVPTVQSTDNQTIVYTIGKMPTDTVKVVDNKGNEVVPSVSKTGKTGSKTGLNTPNIPKGYHVVNITNGNGDKVTGVPSTFGNSDNTTIYHVEKDITDKVYVDVKTESGTVLTPSHEVASGAPGTKIDVQMPEVPNDYHIVKVIVDNKVITPNAEGKYELPKTLSDNQNQEVDNHIEVIVTKNPTTTVEEFYPNGKPVVASKTTTNLEGSKVDTVIPDLPNGYQVTKITVNGKVVSENEVPTVQSKDNQTIVYTIDKMPTDTVKVMYNNTELVPPVSKTGKTGSKTGLTIPDIPNGYHIVNITNGNGDKVTGVPSTFGNSDNTTIYHVEKNTPKDHDGGKTTPEDHNGDNTPKDHEGGKTTPESHNGENTPKDHDGGKTTPENHNGENTPKNHDGGKTTPENHNGDNTPKDHEGGKTTPESHNGENTPKDHEGEKTTPENHNGENTPKNHDGGKTTPENHNGDNTPKDHEGGKTTPESHNGENTPKDHDGGKTTPENHNGENTPKNHDGGKTTPENHNGDNTPKDHEGGKITPENHNGENTPENHDEGKTTPVVNHNNDKTTLENHNSDETTPVNHDNNHENKVNNSSNTSSTINTLPHTGIGQSQDNVAKEAGALAGIIGAIAALGIFRRKRK